MARNAAARLLASSTAPLRSSHHHHPRRPRPLLLPTSRSKTSSSKPPRPSPRTDTASSARNPAASAGARPSLFQEISGLVASTAGTASDPPFQPRVNGQVSTGDEALVRCTEGARPNAPESAAAASASFSGRTPDRAVLDGRSDNGGEPCGYAENAAQSREASCEVLRNGNAQDSDIDNISADVQRVTEVLRSLEGTFCHIISALRENHYLEEASNVERMRASFDFKRPKEEMECRPLEKVDTIDESQKLSKSDLEEKKMIFESLDHPSDKDLEVSRPSVYDDTHHIEQTKGYRDEDVEEICRILSSSDNWCSMQQALEMRPLHFNPNLVTAIMKRCKRKGHAALKFFSWVGRRSYYIQTTATYNTAMKLAGSAKDFKHMRHLYREMVWAQCSPTVDTWNVMICQYGNAGLTEMALEAFYQMKQEGFQPDKTTYNHLIMYLSRRKGRKVDAAIKIFKEMIHAGYILDNEVLCTYLLALCDCGLLVDARSSIMSLCKQGFAVQVGYSILLKSLCRSNRMGEAVCLFDDIEKYGCSRNKYMYGSLIHVLLRWDRFEDAVAKLAEMKNAGIRQSTHMYTSFIIYFFRKRDVAKAMDVLKEMTENGCEPTVVTYSALIRGHMEMGMILEAWDVFRRMKLKGPSPDFETYSMFMTCLCKAGRSEDGLQLIHDMLDGGITPSAVNFRTVVHGLNMEGKHKLAGSVLQSKWHLLRQRTFSKFVYG